MGGIRTLAVVLALLLTGTTVVTAQTLKSGHGDVDLVIDSSQIAVKFSASVDISEITAIINDLPGSWHINETAISVGGYLSIEPPDFLGYGNAWAILEAVEVVDYLEPRYRAPDSSPVLTTEHLAVGLDPEFTEDQAMTFLSAVGMQDPEPIWPGTNSYFVTRAKGSGATSFEVADQLGANTDVEYAYPEVYAPLRLQAYTLWDYYHLEQFHLKNLVGQFNQASVWDLLSPNDTTLVGDTIVVAILDDGLDDHIDLPEERILPGYDFYYDDPEPLPGVHQGHGLMCAGIIGAEHSVDSDDTLFLEGGVAGLAPKTKFIPIKITSASDSIFAEVISAFDLKRAVDTAWILGADILNCSFAFQYNFTFLEDAFIRAATLGRNGKGSLIIASSGNISPFWPGGSLRVPALYPEAFVVGACDLDDSLLGYSQYQDFDTAVDVLAPSGVKYGTGASEGVWTLDQMYELGVNRPVDKADPVLPYYCDYDYGNNMSYFCEFDGTSASAAFASGVAALLLAYDPELTREEVHLILDSSAIPLTAVVPDERRGYGRIDAFRAVLSIARGDVNNDGQVTLSDLTILLDRLFVTFEPITPTELLGDVNCDGNVTLTDLQRLVDYLFNTYVPPDIPCYDY